MFLVLLIPQIRLFKATQRHSISLWIVALILSHPYACVNSVVLHLQSTLTNEYFMEWHAGAHTDCPFEYGFSDFRWQKCWKVTFYLRRVNEERRLISRQFLKWLGIPSSKQTCLLWRIAVETDGLRIIDEHHRVALNQLWILICPDMTRYDPLFFVAQWSRITFWWVMVRWHPIAQLLIASERSYTTGWLGIITYITSYNH